MQNYQNPSTLSWIFICIFLQSVSIVIIWTLKTWIKQKKAMKVDDNMTTIMTTIKRSRVKPSIIVGPSGVGKNTLIEALKDAYPNTFGFSVSHTTRKPRSNEVNGVNYHFITKEEFKSKADHEEFIETTAYCDNFYATSKQAIKDVENENKICVLDIHYTAAQKIKKLSMDANYLFITTCGGIQTCVERINKRSTLSEEQIAKRAQKAQEEFDFFEANHDFFDECVSNDDLDQAKKDIIQVFQKWYPWLKYMSNGK